jgi:hypothetical protein
MSVSQSQKRALPRTWFLVVCSAAFVSAAAVVSSRLAALAASVSLQSIVLCRAVSTPKVESSQEKVASVPLADAASQSQKRALRPRIWFLAVCSAAFVSAAAVVSPRLAALAVCVALQSIVLARAVGTGAVASSQEAGADEMRGVVAATNSPLQGVVLPTEGAEPLAEDANTADLKSAIKRLSKII